MKEKKAPRGQGKISEDLFKVKLYPDAALKMPAEAVNTFDDNLAQFMKTLRLTMAAYDGVGLAAPQVGVLKKIAVIEHEKELYDLINPRLIGWEGQQEGDEGCLSFPGIYAQVRRPLRVSVAAMDAAGTERVYNVEGLLARVFLHEMDHLEGRLFIEHLSNLKRSMIRKKMYKRAVGDDE